MGDERERDRKRAAVMVSMLVPAYQMQDAAAIATAAGEALGDPEAVSVGVAATMLRGMEGAGLVDRQPYLGRDDGSEWWSLTDAGLVAAQVMRGVMEGEEGEDGTAEDEGGAQLGCALAFWGEGANPQVEALQALAALVERRCAGCFDAPPSGECEDCLDAADAEINTLIHGINVWMQSGRASRRRVEVGLRAHRLAVLCAVLATANGDIKAAIREEMGRDGTATAQVGAGADLSDDTAGSLRLPPGEGAGATTETATAEGGGDVDQDREGQAT